MKYVERRHTTERSALIGILVTMGSLFVAFLIIVSGVLPWFVSWVLSCIG